MIHPIELRADVNLRIWTQISQDHRFVLHLLMLLVVQLTLGRTRAQSAAAIRTTAADPDRDHST